ncbi:MAG: enoyl-CoA hydratase [Nitrospira sp.]|nr:enoyl-CoA hydratase [Nitrospira sp.]MBP6605662.1 enoyl-CoA hydratase [Nitrospira sp.]HQY58712.1 enoyl-CoA hydratase [Nitrospira sp.]HRA97351.1 enoyl-CoA hydratase [Nitrospira sp.]
MTTIAGSMLSCNIDGAVATLLINHPPANTLTPELLVELSATFEQAAKDDAVKVVVLTGAGRFFIAGADIRVLAAIASSKEGEAIALQGQAILDQIEGFGKPVIAAINGICLGGGLELAMCCHIRFAAEGSRLGQPEINLGIMPGFGGTQRLARLLGQSKALELILTGEPISAQDAKTIGLVSQVFPPEDLLRQAQGLARMIASKGQMAVRASLRAIRQGVALNLHDGLALEARLFGELCDTEDKREGVSAFLEKRQPHFTGR